MGAKKPQAIETWTKFATTADSTFGPSVAARKMVYTELDSKKFMLVPNGVSINGKPLVRIVPKSNAIESPVVDVLVETVNSDSEVNQNLIEERKMDEQT